MSDEPIPLSILDLAPIVSGGDAGDALRRTIDLARRAEAAGYARYWLAEHHFTPGVASSAPAVVIGQVAAATTSIRVGSAAVQTGHQTPLSIVEQFGILDALFPGRIDLGLGRSGQSREEKLARSARAAARSAPADAGSAGARTPRPERADRVVDGLLIPKPFSWAHLLGASRLGRLFPLLQQPGAETPPYRDQVDEVLGLIDGTFTTAEGDPVDAVPGTGSALAVWIFGSSAGASATVAGESGLPFGANYHVSPATVLEAVDAYRAAFQPSAVLDRPYVAVSADVVVAADETTACHLASPYAAWVRSIRTGQGAIPFPTPEQAAEEAWTAEDRELVADRLETQFVGTAESVAERLRTLASVTGADELIVTTITHDHADRVRSFELLADHWHAGGSSQPAQEAQR